jgi:hypothetical protein
MPVIIVEQDGVKKWTSSSFYRGETTNFYPNDGSFERDDAVDKYLVHGWMPKRGFIAKKSPIVAFGSCFAANISNYLHKRGFSILTKKDNNAYVTRMGDGMVHTFAIRQQFEWAWLNKKPSIELWHGYKAEEFGYDETARRDTKTLFDTAEVFVITLGLSEIWYDEPTGQVFWRALPKDKADPSRHKFRVSTVAENVENLAAIHALIRAHRPKASIIFTLSPIPLFATFRPVSCVSANSVSKAILRAALDEFISRAKDSRVFYFPSYEIVMYAFNHQWTVDRRHVYQRVLDFNMRVFERYFCLPAIPDETVLQALRAAQSADRVIAKNGHAAASMLTKERRGAAAEKRMKARIEARKQARLQSKPLKRPVRKTSIFDWIFRQTPPK